MPQSHVPPDALAPAPAAAPLRAGEAGREDGRLWRRFLAALLLTAGLVVAATYAVVLLIDPYDCLWFSPRLERAPVAGSERYAFPALARSARFDSLVIGTSVMRNLRPSELDAALGGRFANLAMDGSTPYEQARLLALFVATHEAPRNLVIATDVAWCQPETPYKSESGDRFPEWLYDDGRWNKLGTLFSATALTDSWRQIRWMLGHRPALRDLDGFAELYPGEDDPERVRTRLYGAGESPHLQPPAVPAVEVNDELRQRWSFPDHATLRTMLQSLPPDTRKIVIFTPIHHYSQGAPGSATAAQWRLCKESVARLAAAIPNTTVLDFMIHSSITLRDDNYRDALHYRIEIGSQLIRLIGEGVERRQSAPGFFDYLAGPNL